MKETKRCIYHIPNYINPEGNSGSSLRPKKMLQGFKDAGYDVDVIIGYGKDRKKQINKIRNKIKDGIKYEFMYSESSTMPTLLTEKHHLPTYPFLDFGFMRFCKKNGIPIALYYRDIYWRFPLYGQGINNIKKKFAIFMYNYDIKKYSKLLDILYLQSMKMAEYLPKTIGNISIKTLPPGCELNNERIEKKNKDLKVKKEDINIFYVGGIGDLYNIEPLLKIVKNRENVRLTICCREEEWKNQKERYEKHLNNRISIVHESGENLEKYYEKADICSLYFPEEEYRKFVLPIKLFEYISHVTPIIATKDTETGKFITENNIGWEIEATCPEQLEKLLDDIQKNRDILLEKQNNYIEVLKQNTWTKRAEQVSMDLKNEKDRNEDNR